MFNDGQICFLVAPFQMRSPNCENWQLASSYLSMEQLGFHHRTDFREILYPIIFLKCREYPSFIKILQVIAVKRYLHETGLAPLRIIPPRTASRSKPFHTILKSSLFLYKHWTFKNSILSSKFEATYKQAYLYSDTGEQECSGITKRILMTWVSLSLSLSRTRTHTHTEWVQVFAKDAQTSVYW